MTNAKKIIFCLVMGALMIGYTSISGCISGGEQITIREELVSLDRGLSVTGTFVLGSGTVGSEPAYFYYVKTGDGGYKLKTVKSKHVTIYMDENTTPYIHAVYVEPVAPIGFNSYRVEFGDLGDDRIALKSSGKAFTAYNRVGEVEIHIPAGSIVREYNP